MITERSIRRAVAAVADPGWLYVVAGLSLAAAVILVPAQNDLEAVRGNLGRLRDADAHLSARLAAHASFLDDLERSGAPLVRRLVAGQLNRVPESERPVLIAPAASASVTEWIDETIRRRSIRTGTRSAAKTESRLSRLTEGPARLWILGGSILCVFAGLIMGPATGRRSRANGIGEPGMDTPDESGYERRRAGVSSAARRVVVAGAVHATATRDGDRDEHHDEGVAVNADELEGMVVECGATTRDRADERRTRPDDGATDTIDELDAIAYAEGGGLLACDDEVLYEDEDEDAHEAEFAAEVGTSVDEDDEVADDDGFAVVDDGYDEDEGEEEDDGDEYDEYEDDEDDEDYDDDEYDDEEEEEEEDDEDAEVDDIADEDDEEEMEVDVEDDDDLEFVDDDEVEYDEDEGEEEDDDEYEYEFVDDDGEEDELDDDEEDDEDDEDDDEDDDEEDEDEDDDEFDEDDEEDDEYELEEEEDDDD